MSLMAKVNMLDVIVDMLRTGEGAPHTVGAVEYRVTAVSKRLGQIHVEMESNDSKTVVVLDVASVRR